MRISTLANFAYAAISTIVIGANPALAATGASPIEEYEKRQGQDARLQSFGTDLLGDQIDPHTGSISFEHVDVSIPGNFGLEVAIRRKRSQGYHFRWSVAAEFGDWSLEVPRIEVITGPQDASHPAWTGNRCTDSMAASLPSYTVGGQGATSIYGSRSYSSGYILNVPGAGAMQMLESVQGAQWSGGPGTARYVTTESWRIDCNDSSGVAVAASDGGQGFFAYAPNGDKYKFTKLIVNDFKELGTMGGTTYLARYKKFLAATEVTDVNGNWVNYNYDASGRLTSITSSDGRTITLSYSGSSKLIASVTANGRTWNYAYAASAYSVADEIDPNINPQVSVLRTVTLPDSTFWNIHLDGQDE